MEIPWGRVVRRPSEDRRARCAMSRHRQPDDGGPAREAEADPARDQTEPLAREERRYSLPQVR